MKKLLTLLKPVLLGALVVFAVACGRSSSDYRNLVPKDALMTIAFNAQSIYDKAGVSEAELTALKGQAQMALAFTGDMFTEEDRQFILSLLDSADNSGISFKHSIYMFMDMDDVNSPEDMTFGLVGKVGDAKKLQTSIDLIKGLDADMESRTDNGLNILVLNERYDNTVLLAWDDNAFMFYRNADEYSATIGRVSQLFKGNGPASILSDKELSKFADNKSDMSMVMSYASFIKVADQQSLAMLGQYRSILESMYIYINSDFEKGKIVSDFGVIVKDKNAKNDLEKLYSKSKLQGQLAHLIPRDALFAASAYMDGEQVYESLAGMPAYSFLAMVPQVKTVLSALQGDFVMAFTGMDIDENNFTGMVATVVKDKEILDYIAGLFEGMAEPRGENVYGISLGGFDVTFGINGDVLYFSNDDAVLAAINGASMDTLADDIQKHFKSGFGTFYLDSHRLTGILMDALADSYYTDESLISVLHFLNVFENIVFYGEGTYDGKMIVNMVDKDQNAMESIVNGFKDIAVSQLGNMFF